MLCLLTQLTLTDSEDLAYSSVYRTQRYFGLSFTTKKGRRDPSGNIQNPFCFLKAFRQSDIWRVKEYSRIEGAAHVGFIFYNFKMQRWCDNKKTGYAMTLF